MSVWWISGKEVARVIVDRSFSGTIRRRLRNLLRGDGGMSTAEYAIGTVAAAAFASLLYTVVTSDAVTDALTSLVQQALEGTF